MNTDELRERARRATLDYLAHKATHKGETLMACDCCDRFFPEQTLRHLGPEHYCGETYACAWCTGSPGCCVDCFEPTPQEELDARYGRCATCDACTTD